MSNVFNPDYDWYPQNQESDDTDMGPTCLQRLAANSISHRFQGKSCITVHYWQKKFIKTNWISLIYKTWYNYALKIFMYFTNTFENEPTTFIKNKHLVMELFVRVCCYTHVKYTKYETCAFWHMFHILYISHDFARLTICFLMDFPIHIDTISGTAHYCVL